MRELDDLVQQAGASGGLGGIGAREMVGELNERINILMAENTVMADQVLLNRDLEFTVAHLLARVIVFIIGYDICV